MAPMTTAQEYQAVREAIQLFTTLDENGQRRDKVSFTVDSFSVSYQSGQLPFLREREVELANRICNRNRRKRTSPDFSYLP
jgi:hypothetical protein